MTTSNSTIQYSFQLPAEPIWSIIDGSHDFYGEHGLFFNCFSPIENEKQPLPANEQFRQRHTAFHAIIQKLTDNHLPGKEHAVRHLQHQYRRNFRIQTLRGNGYTIRFFLLFLKKTGCLRLEDLTRQDIEAFVEQEQDKGLTVRSVKTKLTALYAFFNFLVKSGILPPEILERKIRLRLPEALPRAIVFEDVKALLAVVTEVRDRALFLLLLRTGLRIGELLNLQVSDINLQELKICIYIGEKNARGRVVYYCEDAREALMDWLRLRDPEQRYLFYGHQRRPLSYAGARKAFCKYLTKAGLAAKGYTLHQLRHTFASELLNAGMRLEVLQQLLGHSTIEITRHYARLSDNTREEEYFRAMKRIEKEGGCASY